MAGTCAEYEWSREVYPEDAPQHPATLYGAAKHGLHTVAAAYAEQAGLSLVWGGCSSSTGPARRPGASCRRSCGRCSKASRRR